MDICWCLSYRAGRDLAAAVVFCGYGYCTNSAAKQAGKAALCAVVRLVTADHKGVCIYGAS